MKPAKKGEPEEKMILKKNRNIIIVLIILILCAFIILRYKDPKAKIQSYEIVKDGDGDYGYKIYDEMGRLMESGEKAGTEPIITCISEDIVELRLSAGMCSNVTYFDIKNGKTSKTYQDPVFADEGLVAYMRYSEDEKIHLVITNLFDGEKFCFDINLDFYSTARPYDSVEKMERTEDNQFRIFYLSTDENGKPTKKKAVIEVDFDWNTWREIIIEKTHCGNPGSFYLLPLPVRFIGWRWHNTEGHSGCK